MQSFPKATQQCPRTNSETAAAALTAVSVVSHEQWCSVPDCARHPTQRPSTCKPAKLDNQAEQKLPKTRQGLRFTGRRKHHGDGELSHSLHTEDIPTTFARIIPSQCGWSSQYCYRKFHTRWYSVLCCNMILSAVRLIKPKHERWCSVPEFHTRLLSFAMMQLSPTSRRS